MARNWRNGTESGLRKQDDVYRKERFVILTKTHGRRQARVTTDEERLLRPRSSYIQFTPPDQTRQNCRVCVASGGVDWVRRQSGIVWTVCWSVTLRHGTGSHFVTQRPSDPEIQRPGDPVDPVTLLYNELQMSTYAAYKRLQWARGLPVFIVVWRLHASGK